MSIFEDLFGCLEESSIEIEDTELIIAEEQYAD